MSSFDSWQYFFVSYDYWLTCISIISLITGISHVLQWWSVCDDLISWPLTIVINILILVHLRPSAFCRPCSLTDRLIIRSTSARFFIFIPNIIINIHLLCDLFFRQKNCWPLIAYFCLQWLIKMVDYRSGLWLLILFTSRVGTTSLRSTARAMERQAAATFQIFLNIFSQPNSCIPSTSNRYY